MDIAALIATVMILTQWLKKSFKWQPAGAAVYILAAVVTVAAIAYKYLDGGIAFDLIEAIKIFIQVYIGAIGGKKLIPSNGG